MTFNKQLPTADLRTRPTYSLPEAARLLRVNEITLRNWTLGRPHPSGGHIRHAAPLIVPAGKQGLERISFFNLMEGHVLAALRGIHGLPLSKIRTATMWLKEHRKSEFPLLELDLETDGLDLFVRELGQLVSASESGQTVIREIIEKYLYRIERDEVGLPCLFYPFTREPGNIEVPKAVVIDPGIAFGRPVVKGTRITTAAIMERYAAGDNTNIIAVDYGLSVEQVDESIRCEIHKAA